MNIVERNNIVITGQGDKSMLFSHGYGCDQTIWHLVAPAFEAHYQVILYDLVGSGKSNISMYDRCKYSTLSGYADDLVEIGQELDVQGGIFVGHSISCMIGILAAIKDPLLFERLILIAPSPCFIDDTDYKGGFSADAMIEMLQFMESNYESWAKAIAPVIMGNSRRPELARELIEYFCRNKPDVAQHFAQVAFLGDHRKELPKLTVPSLILQCSDDELAPLEVGSYVHRELKNSDFRLMKATGHCPHVSAPEETIELILQYIEAQKLK